MRSGSHITHTLYPPCDAFMLSRRESRSLSAPVMMACWFLGAHRLHPLLYAEVGSIAEQFGANSWA